MAPALLILHSSQFSPPPSSSPAPTCPRLRPLPRRRPHSPLQRRLTISHDGNRNRECFLHSRLRHVRPPAAAAAVASTIIAAGDQWGNWAFLLSAAAFGTWGEERTPWGAALSRALVSILAGLAATAAGLVPPGAPAHGVVMEYLLPVAVPLLLLGADLRRVVRATGDLLKAFLIGSVATVIGTTVAYLLLPMRSLGQESWKIAAALMGSYIGGAVNFVAISEALGTSPSVLAAGVAADNLISALYFLALFSLASKIPPEPKKTTTTTSQSEPAAAAAGLRERATMSVLEGGAALALSFTICKAASAIASALGIAAGGTLPCATALVVSLATAFPGAMGRLAPAGEAMALVLLWCSSRRWAPTAAWRTPRPRRPPCSPSCSCRSPCTSPSCSAPGGSSGWRGRRCSWPRTPMLAGRPPRPPWPRPKGGAPSSSPGSLWESSASPLPRSLASASASSCSRGFQAFSVFLGLNIN